ncbi:MAG: EAL domain-containing protein [Usitatibacter sp.]
MRYRAERAFGARIASHGPRQAIVRAISQVCIDLGIDFVVEGVATTEEFAWFEELGAHLFQGYLSPSRCSRRCRLLRFRLCDSNSLLQI